MASLTPEIVEALNALLEDERASVRCEVALACGATEYAERDAFTQMGREDIAICVALHEALSHVEVPISLAVGAAAEAILDADEYDRRLRAFAEHQRAVSRRADKMAPEVADPSARQIVHRLRDLHTWHVQWADRRAEDFAATRLWENGRKPWDGQDAARRPEAASALAADEALLARPVDQENGSDGHGGA